MENLGTAKTVAELIEVLSKLDPDSGWYGWDDGCIIITGKDGSSETGYIEGC